MRGATKSWLTILGLAGCSCGQPASVDTSSSAVAPEPVVPQAEAEPEPAPAEPEPDPLPPGPILTEAAVRGHEAAQAKLMRGDERLPPLLSLTGSGTDHVPTEQPSEGEEGPIEAAPAEVAPQEPAAEGQATPEPPPMPGAFVPITEPARGPALAHFHEALAALERGEDLDGKVRVAMYGASGTAADLSVGYVRTYLQTRFGDGGPGFVPIAPLNKWYRHSEVVVDASKGWTKEHAQIRSGRLDGHYGLLGASFSATTRKRWTTIEPKTKSTSAAGVAQVELYFLRQPGGGSFKLKVDGGKAEVVSTEAESIQAGYHPLSLSPGPHTIRVETVDDEKEVRMFGVVLERPDPGVVVDVLGINGTRGANHLTWNEALWADNLARRAPDLYTLSYGTNESVDEDMSIITYAEDLRAQLHRFSAVLPDASCLLLGPVDFPIREDGQLFPRPLLNQIIEVQKQVAAEEGCGYWDGVRFMGGELSMAQWVEFDPPLARGDYLHFTLRGAARKGMALSDALMHAYDGRSMGPTP